VVPIILSKPSVHRQFKSLEVKMKKLSIVISFIIAAGLVISAFTVYAEMAKEGSGDYKSAKSGTFEVLAMGKERVQMNYQEMGVVVGAPENCPIYNATFTDIGTLHAINGKFESSAFLEYTCTNGDKVYATTNAVGMLGSGVDSGIATFVGGTGSCEGIQGTIEYKKGAQLKPSKKGTYSGISVGKLNWKIP
jgi:hypothetical protein